MNPAQLLEHFDRLSEAPDALPRLRRFILDLAVRGKLVEQDPDDEPASELIKRIRAEKVRRIKLGEIRSPRGQETTDEIEELYQIPPIWGWIRLSSVGSIIGGGTPSSGDFDNFTDGGKGIPWLTPADLGKHRGLFISHGARDLSQQGLKTSSATLMPTGSVLFTSRAPIGYTAIASNPITTNQGFKSVIPYITELSRFVALYFQAFAPWIDGKASGTTFREVSAKIVASLPFPLPPLAEQHRIVAKVDELMALCDRLEAAKTQREQSRERLVAASLQRLNQPADDAEAFREDARFTFNHLPRLTTRPAHIKQLRQTILNLAVRGKLVEQDPNDEPATELLKRIQKEKMRVMPRCQDAKEENIKGKEMIFQPPQGWQWVRFGELITDADSGWSPKSEGFQKSGENWGVLKVSAVSWDKFLPNENKQLLPGVVPPKTAQVRLGDFLISRANTSELVAKCVIVKEEPVNLILSDKIVRLKISEMCDKRFICMVNNHAEYARSHYANKASGTSLSMKNVSRPVIYELAIPLPPLAEQHRIVAKVDELMALCDQLEAQLTTTAADSRRLLEAVLHEALTPARQQAA
jgi:type I restriction enzyme, S subunit